MWGKAQTMVMLGQFSSFSCCVWPIAWRLPETGDQQQDDVLRHDPNVGTASGKHCVAILSFTVPRHPKHQKMPLELEIHGGKKKLGTRVFAKASRIKKSNPTSGPSSPSSPGSVVRSLAYLQKCRDRIGSAGPPRRLRNAGKG